MEVMRFLQEKSLERKMIENFVCIFRGRKRKCQGGNYDCLVFKCKEMKKYYEGKREQLIVFNIVGMLWRLKICFLNILMWG